MNVPMTALIVSLSSNAVGVAFRSFEVHGKLVQIQWSKKRSSRSGHGRYTLLAKKKINRC